MYYACIRSDAGGRVRALPGLRAPLVTYRLTDADLSRLARGLVHLGEALLAAGRHRAARVGHRRAGGAVASADLGAWWDAVDRRRANLMTVHLTSSVRMAEGASRRAVDSFGPCAGVDNLRVSDASLLPEAPGVNPQAAVMTLAARNADHLLASLVTRSPTRSSSPAPAAGSGGTSWRRWRPSAPRVRVLVQTADEAAVLALVGRSRASRWWATSAHPARSTTLFDGVAPGATVVHAAAVIHPTGGVRELFDVNVGGTVARARPGPAARAWAGSSTCRRTRRSG